MRVLLLMPALVLALAAAAPQGLAPASVGASLRITVWPRGPAGSTRAYTLRCPAGSGSLPASESACRKLAGLGRKAFARVPPRTVCTQIYGGPQEARVTGRFRGRSLRATFSRRNGCEIARWDRLAFLFPVRTGP